MRSRPRRKCADGCSLRVTSTRLRIWGSEVRILPGAPENIAKFSTICVWSRWATSAGARWGHKPLRRRPSRKGRSTSLAYAGSRAVEWQIDVNPRRRPSPILRMVTQMSLVVVKPSAFRDDERKSGAGQRSSRPGLRDAFFCQRSAFEQVTAPVPTLQFDSRGSCHQRVIIGGFSFTECSPWKIANHTRPSVIGWRKPLRRLNRKRFCLIWHANGSFWPDEWRGSKRCNPAMRLKSHRDGRIVRGKRWTRDQ